MRRGLDEVQQLEFLKIKKNKKKKKNHALWTSFGTINKSGLKV